MENCDIPDDLIQIKANGSEMRTRIMALMECKRRQADRRNELDFFKMERKDRQCARVDAQVNRRKGERSHLQVRFVSNAWGPQTTHAVDLNPVAKERSTSTHSVVHPNQNTPSSSQTHSSAMTEVPSSSQSKASANQASHEVKSNYLEVIGKKRAASLDDIEIEIEKLEKKMKS
ncbi:hypothetical protein LSTR_LSTR002812 [Laodelphax striatellus]|uniref:Uncharacterized protein n=1 Tax=Laodelphax striatellus TaxID=195883 RepID=A0A482XIN8_LAOST|nr:hypothetical protein LSTR_LSTR002812 [Laodelphax striatellus]